MRGIWMKEKGIYALSEDLQLLWDSNTCQSKAEKLIK